MYCERVLQLVEVPRMLARSQREEQKRNFEKGTTRRNRKDSIQAGDFV